MPQKLSSLLEDLMTSGKVLDGVLAQDSTQFTSLWKLREGIPEACGKTGAVYKYDVSIPVADMYAVCEAVRKRLQDKGLLKGDGTPEGPVKACVGYGHMGDGNIHLNIVANKYTDEIEAAIEPYVYEVVCK